MKLGLTSVLLGLVIIITAPDWARAICVEVRPCEAYGLADAIFIGRLIGSRPAPDAGTEYVLRVLRDIRGVWTDTVVVHGGMTSVDVRFDASEPYVVYGRRLPDGRVVTSVCMRTRVLSQAQEDTAYFTEIAMNRSSSHVFGDVKLYTSGADSASAQPGSGIVVRAKAGWRERRDTADAEGHFEMVGLPDDNYGIAADAPTGYVIFSTVDSITTSLHGCTRVDLWAYRAVPQTPSNRAAYQTRRITGIVRHTDGTPAAGATVQALMDAGAHEVTSVETNSDGTFEIWGSADLTMIVRAESKEGNIGTWKTSDPGGPAVELGVP